MPERAARLRRGLAEIGFDDARFAAAGPAPAAGLRQWLEAGRHADMSWMERTADKRLDPGRVLPGARSLILLGINYWNGTGPGAGRPAWARYSQYSDYHDTIRAGLVRAGKLLEEIYGSGPGDYRFYSDTGPVLERGWAARAGLGFIGKNAMLISRRHGNWLMLAAILTRVELPADPPVAKDRGGLRAADPAQAPENPVGLLCGKCTRCLDACPTDAFPAPGVVDANRCISYQTIENRGVIPVGMRAAIGARVFGCDTCLDVCPWNRFARAGRQVLMESRPELAGLNWSDLLAMTPERFAAVFRKTAVKRLKLAGLLRNACIGAGNSGDQSLIPSLVRLAGASTPLVRAHAVWAVRRLAGDRLAAELLAAARAGESDPGVLSEYPTAI